jgi:serine/threonine protein kinase
MTGLPDFIVFKPQPGTPLPHIFTAAGDDLILLLQKLLSVNPQGRCNCTEALQLPYFRYFKTRYDNLVVFNTWFYLATSQHPRKARCYLFHPVLEEIPTRGSKGK